MKTHASVTVCDIILISDTTFSDNKNDCEVDVSIAQNLVRHKIIVQNIQYF